MIEEIVTLSTKTAKEYIIKNDLLNKEINFVNYRGNVIAIYNNKNLVTKRDALNYYYKFGKWPIVYHTSWITGWNHQRKNMGKKYVKQNGK